MPRLYAYPATLSRSVYRARDRVRARRVTRGERGIQTRRAAPRFPFVAPHSVRAAPRRAVPHRTPPRVSREGAVPTRREVPFAVQLHVPFARDRLASLVPVRADFHSSFSFFIPFSFFFFPPVFFPSRGLVFVRLAKCPQIPCNVRGHSFDFSPALLGFCYWTDLSVSYNDYCYRSLGIDPGA